MTAPPILLAIYQQRICHVVDLSWNQATLHRPNSCSVGKSCQSYVHEPYFDALNQLTGVTPSDLVQSEVQAFTPRIDRSWLLSRTTKNIFASFVGRDYRPIVLHHVVSAGCKQPMYDSSWWPNHVFCLLVRFLASSRAVVVGYRCFASR